jgi:DNA-binding MarR family transcriptional regulator
MTDVAAEPTWLSPDEQSAWRAYLDMTARLSAVLNRELQVDAGISLPDFAVLVPLSEHVDGSMRARDLALALGWEKSRLSHQLARMQRRGLVERRDCDEDKRAAVVALTAEGRRTIDAAAPVHVAGVRRYLFDHLGPAELAAFGTVVTGVVHRLDEVCDPAPCPSTQPPCAPEDPCG